MKMLELRFTVICSIILLQVCVLVRGRYLVEVNVFGYSNPTQTCQDCRDGGQFANPGCCDTHNGTICVESDRCDSYFFYCLRTTGSSGRNCSYFGGKVSTVNYQDEPVDFSQNSVLGLENPLQLQGLRDTYFEAGLQLYIEMKDNDRDLSNSDDFIDVVLIDHNLAVGNATPRRSYTGEYGFVTMDLSITVLCAHNFEGSDCTECVPGFVGDYCGDAKKGGSNLIGPLVGGVLGGLCVLLLLLLLIVVAVILAVILSHRKSEDKTTHTRAPEGQGVQVVLNQMYDGSPGNESSPLYEEIADHEIRAQYVNLSPSDCSTRDSVLTNNPIYGGEERNIGDSLYITSVDRYDRTFQPSATADNNAHCQSGSYSCISSQQLSIEENVAYGQRDCTGDSELEDNPIYGGEEVNIGDGVHIALDDHYDQTIEPPILADNARSADLNQAASYDKWPESVPQPTKNMPSMTVLH